jgi:transcriptional regulator with XRE-family HTH domain
MAERIQNQRCLLSEELHARFTKRLQEMKFTQQQIADTARVDRNTVSKVIKNDPASPFQSAKAESILQACDVIFKDNEIVDGISEVTASFDEISLSSPFLGASAKQLLSICTGRDELLSQIFEALNLGLNKNLLGAARLGKTWLLEEIRTQGMQRMTRQIQQFVYINLRSINPGGLFFPTLCEELKIDPPLRGRDLARQLGKKKYVVCLDNIDQFQDDQRFTKLDRDQLCDLCDGADRPLSMVVASQVPLRELFPDDPQGSSPFADLCSAIEVRPVSLQQVTNFIIQSLTPLGMAFTTTQIEGIHQMAAGKPQEIMLLADRQYQNSIQSRS